MNVMSTQAGKPSSTSIAFGMKALKKFPELIPLVSILTFASTMAISFTAYSLYQKPDVQLVKSKEVPPFERVNPEQAQKLHTINIKYVKNPELEALRKEIGSYKS